MTLGKAVLAAVLLLPTYAAGAAEEPRAEQHSQTLRSYVLRNRADQPVVDAHAFTTTNKDMNLTDKGPIQPLHAQEFMVEQTECVNRVTAKLQDGRALHLDNITNCRAPTIWVSNDGISVESSAAGTALPGGPRDTLPQDNAAKEHPPR